MTLQIYPISPAWTVYIPLPDYKIKKNPKIKNYITIREHRVKSYGYEFSAHVDLELDLEKYCCSYNSGYSSIYEIECSYFAGTVDLMKDNEILLQ